MLAEVLQLVCGLILACHVRSQFISTESQAPLASKQMSTEPIQKGPINMTRNGDCGTLPHIHTSLFSHIPSPIYNSVAEVQFRTDPENQNRQNRTENLVLFCSGSLSSLPCSVLGSLKFQIIRTGSKPVRAELNRSK